jgi:hypothetical protein
MKSIIRAIRNNSFLKIFLILIPVGMAIVPLAAMAQTITPTSVTAPNIWPTGYWAPKGIVSCDSNYLTVTAGSTGRQSDASGAPYCQDMTDLIQTFVNVVYLAMSVAIFIIAPILFLVGAVTIMMAGAKPDLLTKGRQTLVGTAVGLVIVLCSYLIVNTVISVFNISGITGFSSSAPAATPTP